MSNLIDLTNKRFGKLTVLHQVSSKKYNGARWLCQCDCGKQKEIGGRLLREGRTQSCGCYRSEKMRMGRVRYKQVDLTGERFGRLVVVQRVFNRGRETCWLCKCDCGKEVEILRRSLTGGKTRSCGCLRDELVLSRVILESGLAAKRAVYQKYIQSAKRRNLPFELSFEQFLSLAKQNCYYCGIEPFKEYIPLANNGSFIYQGIDRVNNKEGYTVRNSLPCCSPCNYAKNNMPQDEFVSWIKRASNHINQVPSGYEC